MLNILPLINTCVERSAYLHLFLHARGLLSAAIRMNTIGPYAAQQLLLHTVRPIVSAEAERCGHLRTGLCTESSNRGTLDNDSINDYNSSNAQMLEGPAMTWPLGEILAARHDLQHSRIFNS